MGSTTTPDRDLQVPEGDPWASLAVPRGWGEVAEVCREIHDDLGAVADRITVTIEETLPGYARSAVPRPDLHRSVERNVADLLLGIAERRDPTPDEVRRRATLGARRATQGLPVDTLLQAFHVGYRELWEHLVERAGGARTDLSPLLLQAATTMWTWSHRSTDALGHAHAETLRTMALRAASVRQRFLELVLSGDHESEDALTLARTLDFDATGDFRAYVLVTVALDGSEAPALQASCEALDGNHQVITQGTRLVVLAQGEVEEDTAPLLAAQLPEAMVGVGLLRPGLDGARLSVGDGERAAALPRRPRVVSFAETWPWALMVRDLDRALPLVEPAIETARSHPHLAEAVTAYARDGSVAEAGRTLQLHPNTVTYRLERWAELSGWDARSFDGLLRSVIALRLPL